MSTMVGSAPGLQLPPSCTDCKHLPSHHRPSRRSSRHIARATAKALTQKLHQTGSLRDNAHLIECLRDPASFCPPVLLSDLGSDPVEKLDLANPRLQIERTLRNQVIFSHMGTDTEWKKSFSFRQRFDPGDIAEGRELAQSDLPLPGDQSRLIRHRSVDENDFLSRSKFRIVRRPVTEDAQVADLYRRGILYDNDKDAAEPFTLNTIKHTEPLYAIRHAKRTRKLAKGRPHSGSHLDLNLSFSDLGADDEIAQYTSHSRLSRSASNELVQHASRQSVQDPPPLRVIYELSGSSPCFEVDTSQPPVLDGLSDYDFFSEDDLDDATPPQTEIHESPEHQPADTWVMLE